MPRAANVMPRLQAHPTRLLGRGDDLETIGAMLRDDGVRLFTLTGPAGVGKTRLAVEASDQMSGDFAQGVVFIDLSLVWDPSRVPQALARGIGLQDMESKDLIERLFAHLRERRSLIILDNFEQVLPAASWLADLLATCPNITLLVTSREALRLRWEQTYLVSPLALPDPDHLLPPEELSRVPAVALFLERARALDPKFALGEGNARAVAELCGRLDGLPLAIELAAARTGVLSPRMILERLEGRLSLLRWEALDLPERQHTLRGAIGWSYELLDAREQDLFRCLSVFAGSFTMEAAGTVASASGKASDEKEDGPATGKVLDTLASLVEKSLVQVEGRNSEDVRYRLLESVREYALEQLEVRDEGEAVRRSHADYFLALAERAGPELIGREQRAWFLLLEQEHDDLSAALLWLSSRGEDDLALRLGAALGYFWWMRGHFAEGRRFLEDLAGRAPGGAADQRAPALNGLGMMLLFQGEMERARAVLEEGLAAARSVDHPRSVTLSLVCLGIYAMVSGNPEEGTPLLEEALAYAREAGDSWGTARAMHDLGVNALHTGDYERAERLLEEARAGYRQIGDERSMAEALLWLGMAVGERGEVSRAAALFGQVLDTSQSFEDRRLFNMCIDAVVWLVGEEADPEEVTRLMGVNEALHQITGIAHDAWEHTPFAPAVATLSARLDEKKLEAAQTEGHALSLEQMAELAQQVLDEAAEAGARRAEPGSGSRQDVLSPRETEVLNLVADGRPDREISERLFITERTVRHHLTSVFGKLGAENRTQAVALAQQQNLM